MVYRIGVDAVVPFDSSKLVSLREVVYNYLREKMNTGELLPGSFFNLREISEALGISTTPLREALVQLETEGFITIFHRRGAMANALSPKTIRNIYTIIGALESAALMCAAPRLTSEVLDAMEGHTDAMVRYLKEENFDEYLTSNSDFHKAYIDLSDNEELIHRLDILKQRLYDFPRNYEIVYAWEDAGLAEHREILRILRTGNFSEAARYLREVHWNYDVQEEFVRQYYAKHLEAVERKKARMRG